MQNINSNGTKDAISAPPLTCPGCISRDEIIAKLAGKVDELQAENTRLQQVIPQIPIRLVRPASRSGLS